MRRFVEGVDRGQTTLFPECLEDWIGEDNAVRVIDVFVDELDSVRAWVQRGRYLHDLDRCAIRSRSRFQGIGRDGAVRGLTGAVSICVLTVAPVHR